MPSCKHTGQVGLQHPWVQLGFGWSCSGCVCVAPLAPCVQAGCSCWLSPLCVVYICVSRFDMSMHHVTTGPHTQCHSHCQRSALGMQPPGVLPCILEPRAPCICVSRPTSHWLLGICCPELGLVGAVGNCSQWVCCTAARVFCGVVQPALRGLSQQCSFTCASNVAAKGLLLTQRLNPSVLFCSECVLRGSGDLMLSVAASAAQEAFMCCCPAFPPRHVAGFLWLQMAGVWLGVVRSLLPLILVVCMTPNRAKSNKANSYHVLHGCQLSQLVSHVERQAPHRPSLLRT